LSADKYVLNFLCDTAIQTEDDKDRETIIQTLKASSVRNEANACFINYASNSPKPLYRKWALINLNSMECNTAKNTVLSGLQDSHVSVRAAATLNARHYYDEDEIRALRRMLETSKFKSFIISMITAAKQQINKLLKRIEKDLRDSKNPEVPFPW
jgi:hypothetical protein